MRRDEKDDGEKQPAEIPFRIFFLFSLIYAAKKKKSKRIRKQKKGKEERERIKAKKKERKPSLLLLHK